MIIQPFGFFQLTVQYYSNFSITERTRTKIINQTTMYTKETDKNNPNKGIYPNDKQICMFHPSYEQNMWFK